METTLFLIMSAHRGWRRLRPQLQESAAVHVVGETRAAEQAVAAVAALRPAVILVDSAVTDSLAVPLMRQMHEASPASKLFVLGDEEALDRDVLIELGPLLTAYVTWADLRRGTVLACLALIMEHGLLVGSPVVRDMALLPRERRRQQREHDIVLTAQERVVLPRLAEGLNQEEIAAAENMSVRTVTRVIASLKARFDVSTTAAVVAKATQWGFLS